MTITKISWIVFLIVLHITSTNGADLISFNEGLGLIVGENVRVRKSPDVNSGIVRSLNTGDLVMMRGKTEKPERLIKSREFHYHWYSVEYAPGKTGWVYGQYLYAYNTVEKDAYETPINYNGKKYRLLIFREQQISYEMPDSDSYAAPCLYDVQSGKVFMFMINPALYRIIRHRESDTRNLFLLAGNTGFHEGIIKAPYMDKKSIIVPVNLSFQEGGAMYDIVAQYRDGRFEITDIRNYKRADGR